jgi:resolvase, N-terminal domain protein
MLIIDEEEAKVVRYIYDWYLEGYSIGGIIDKLAEKKIKTFPKVKNDGVKERLN